MTEYQPTNDLEFTLYRLIRPDLAPEVWAKRREAGMGDGELERALINEHHRLDHKVLPVYARFQMDGGRPELRYKDTTLHASFLVARVREYLGVPRTEDLHQLDMFGGTPEGLR